MNNIKVIRWNFFTYSQKEVSFSSNFLSSGDYIQQNTNAAS